MANIVFTPMCSECRGLLFDVEIGITTEYMDDLYHETYPYTQGYPEIHPFKCPYCGKVFKNIISFDPRLANGGLITIHESILNYRGDDD